MLPSFTTNITSAFCIVDSLWAITKQVLPFINSDMASCIFISVRESTFDVASSSISIGDLESIALAIVNFAKLMVFDDVGWRISLVVSVTMISAVVFAKVVGSILPVIAKKIGFDPAVMSSPFISTIVDAVTLLIYFSIAASLLNL